MLSRHFTDHDLNYNSPTFAKKYHTNNDECFKLGLENDNQKIRKKCTNASVLCKGKCTAFARGTSKDDQISVFVALSRERQYKSHARLF